MIRTRVIPRVSGSAISIELMETGMGTKSRGIVTWICSDVYTDIKVTETKLVGTSGQSEYFCMNIAIFEFGLSVLVLFEHVWV